MGLRRCHEGATVAGSHLKVRIAPLDDNHDSASEDPYPGFRILCWLSGLSGTTGPLADLEVRLVGGVALGELCLDNCELKCHVSSCITLYYFNKG